MKFSKWMRYYWFDSGILWFGNINFVYMVFKGVCLVYIFCLFWIEVLIESESFSNLWI